MELSGVGLWSSQLRYGNPTEAAEAAAEEKKRAKEEEKALSPLILVKSAP